MKRELLLFIPLISWIGCELLNEDDDSPNTSYNCNNDECFSADEGSGQYATLADCTSVCGGGTSNGNSGYNCVNSDCFAQEGGQYATLDDCVSVCNSSPESILGTWIDKIEGGWVVTIANGPFYGNWWSGCYQIELANSNEALYSGFDSRDDWQTTGMIGSCAGHQASWGWDDGAVWYIWPLAYHELLTFYEDGSFVVQKSRVSPHYYDENNELVSVDYWDGQFPSNLSLGSILESPDPYNAFSAHKSGTWAYDGSVLDLSVYGYTFAVELNGNSLTLDRSLVGQEGLITTWERL